jgi:puromycin-sensitive aminopeptidase
VIFSSPGHLDTLLRALVIGRLGWFEDEAVVAEAQKRFEAHISGGPVIPADLRSAVYRAVLSAGDESSYNTMLRVS